MRLAVKVILALVALPTVLSQVPANALPYDPYPWCAEYSAGMAAAARIVVFSPSSNAGRPLAALADFACPTSFIIRNQQVAAVTPGIAKHCVRPTLSIAARAYP